MTNWIVFIFIFHFIVLHFIVRFIFISLSASLIHGPQDEKDPKRFLLL